MTPSAPQVITQLPNQPAPPPVFGSAPQGSKPKAKSTAATFLGADTIANAPASPSTSTAGKTLLGQ